ncbi:MAG: hypothetical protein ACREP4_06565 [Stenotrophomonas sp.]|uniref:hypothetical protein n=1 Tax=Stenotrophomonas sp. TaxID=69392 RepID=UPI003D6D0D22
MAIQGWGWPIRAAKPHYFSDGTSLCGKWDLYGGPLESGRARKDHDCQLCAKAFNKSPVMSDVVIVRTSTSLTCSQRSEVRH